MKPTSIIFLIVSAFLVISGILVCCAGMIKAAADDTPLYEYTENEKGEIETEFVFTGKDVSRIKVTVQEANVKIICGANEDRVVVKNIISSGLSSAFECAVQNRTLSIENQNLFSLTDLAQGQVNFKGFRYALRYFNNKDKYDKLNKEITVYISNDFDIKSFDINVGKGTVEISNYENTTDFNVEIDTGDITLSNITTSSNVLCNISNEGKIKLSGVSASVVDLKTAKGSIDAIVNSGEVKTSCGTGDVLLKLNKDKTYNYDLSSPLSDITVNGNNRGKSYIITDAMIKDYVKSVCTDGKIEIQFIDFTTNVEKTES